MGFLNRSKNKQSEYTQQTYSIYDTNKSNGLPSNFIGVPRADGSTIYISQIKDNMGYPCYEQIGNKFLPKFNVIAPELEHISPKGILTKVHTILIDFQDINDVQKLNDPSYMSQIVNVLLNANRMRKIVEQYHNYAGGLNVDSNGRVIGKYIDQNVINYLEMTKKERIVAENNARKNAQYERTAAAARQGSAQYIQNSGPSPEAELLNPDMLNPNGGFHTFPDGYDR